MVCKKSSIETHVTKFYHRESEFYICPQQIPILIYNPQELVGFIGRHRYITSRSLIARFEKMDIL